MTALPVKSLPASESGEAVPQRVIWIALLFAGLAWFPTMARCSIEWSINAQYYYGWAVPLLAIYLAYERAEHLPALHPPRTLVWPVLLIAIFALPQPALRLVSEANSDWRLILWFMGASAVGVSFGLFFLAGGWGAVRHFAFPVLFLATAIPWPSFAENGLVQGMMQLNASVSADFVTLCGVPAIATGNVIELPTGVLGVNEACSGIRSLQSTLMASIFLGGLYQISPLARVALVASGVGLAFFFNVVRTVFLSWQGAFHGIEATEKWHDSAGFVILGTVLVCLWLISRYFEKRDLKSRAARTAALASLPG
ncbi:MAG TPA: exosortase/archaeosortase family protein [Chthoniobacterales bacterium]|nr:exosortase/archaeosortase family protein [Chthoniobacterales bacterium]